jgi:hypothetical protein
MRLGAGLLGLGYGVYRLSQGRKDWVTSTALTAGLTATLTGMKAKRGMGPQMRAMGNVRQLRRTAMGVAPAMMHKARTMIDALT